MKLFRLLFRLPEPITLYRAGSLIGPTPLTETELSTALRSNRDHLALKACAQLIESYAQNADAMAHWDQRIKDGMSPHYLMAASYLNDLLADLQDLTEGRQPDRPRPKHPSK